MKKHIGFISLDFSLASRLSDVLRTAPHTHAAQELLEGLEELMNGSADLCCWNWERSIARPRQKTPFAAAGSPLT